MRLVYQATKTTGDVGLSLPIDHTLRRPVNAARSLSVELPA
jgi:hypothetical protein